MKIEHIAGGIYVNEFESEEMKRLIGNTSIDVKCLAALLYAIISKGAGKMLKELESKE